MVQFVKKISRLCCLAGGLVLCLLVGLTCLSVAGRAVNSLLYSSFFQSHMPALAKGLLATGIGPINGDYELVEAGMAFVVFAFLPICQLQMGHASVDILTHKLPEKWQGYLTLLAELIFAGILVLITWQLGLGLFDKWRSHETTLLLEMPVWYAYGLSWGMALAAAFVGLTTAYYRIAEILFSMPNPLMDTGDKS